MRDIVSRTGNVPTADALSGRYSRFMPAPDPQGDSSALPWSPYRDGHVQLMSTIWHESVGVAGAPGAWPMWDHVDRIFYAAHPNSTNTAEVFDSIPDLAGASERAAPFRAVWQSEIAPTVLARSIVGLTLAGLIELADRSLIPDSYPLDVIQLLHNLAEEEARLPSSTSTVASKRVELRTFTARIRRGDEHQVPIPDDMTARVLLRELANPLNMFTIDGQWQIELSGSRLRAYLSIRTFQEYKNHVAKDAIRRGQLMPGRFISGSRLGHDDVEVIHDRGLATEERHQMAARIQPELGFFEVDAPIHEDDIVIVEDPRGGTRELVAGRVDIFNQGSARMHHIEVHWASRPPTPETSQAQISINGHHATIALNTHGDVHQSSTINVSNPNMEGLAKAVVEALTLIEQSADLDEDERDSAQEAGRSVLEEAARPEPDARHIKKSLTTLRGALTGIATSGATTAVGVTVTELVKQLVFNAS